VELKGTCAKYIDLSTPETGQDMKAKVFAALEDIMLVSERMVGFCMVHTPSARVLRGACTVWPHEKSLQLSTRFWQG